MASSWGGAAPATLVDAGERDGQLSALEALGYAGAEFEGSGEGEMFVFPPPGAGSE